MYKKYILFSFLLILNIGCGAPKNIFVLMPDDNGHVGSLVVTNKGGSQILTEPGQSTAVRNINSAPTNPKTMSQEQIEKEFGAALGAHPLPPKNFILYFEFDGSRLTSESLRILPNILKLIKKRQAVDISVSGHSDRIGSKAYNITLSKQRADWVRNYLIEQGIEPQYIESSSHGEGNPLIPTPDNVSEPKNRRVEVTIR